MVYDILKCLFLIDAVDKRVDIFYTLYIILRLK